MLRLRLWPLTPLMTLLLAAAPAFAQDKGGIVGRVTDKRTGHAIPFATVTIPGAKRGGLTDSEGQYQIGGLLAGNYEVRIQFLGYKPVSRAGVVVSPGKPAVADFQLEEVVVREEKVVEVIGERRLVEVRQGATIRGANAAEIRNLPVQTVGEVLQRQAGISADAEQIHVRGGRADETVFMVNGVANRNLITGQSTVGQLNARSVSEVNVATGAFDVRFGDALSGVVEVKLKEPTETFHTGITTSGSSYGGRAWQVVVSGRDPLFGPLLHVVGLRPSGTLSSILDVSSSLYDSRFRYLNGVSGGAFSRFEKNFFLPDEPYRLHSSYEDSFFGHAFSYPDMFSPSAENHWSARYGLTWKPNDRDKVSFDLSKRIAIDQGFSRLQLNLSGLPSDPAYPWQWAHRPDHAGTFFEDNLQSNLEWRRVLGTTGYFNLLVSRYLFAQRHDVQGKLWTQYEQPNDLDAFPNGDPRAKDYFLDTGDANVWEDQRSQTISTQASLVKRLNRRNEIGIGFQHDARSLQYVRIEDPWNFDPSGLGNKHDLWRVHPWLGDLYARDRIEYEGFTANFGVRLDYWFVGREVETAIADTSNPNVTRQLRDNFYADTRSFFGRRYKLRWSPRLIVAHPISENSSFFFNYGMFTQIPSGIFPYSKLTSISSESFTKLGNPDLNPQVTINYELGGKDEFLPGSAANLTFFVKDTYDYADAVKFNVQQSSGSQLPASYTTYLNGSYARSRGFELEVERRRARFWSGRIQYTFSQTHGKTSDPNEQRASIINGGSAGETPVTEHIVTWNRPHKVGVTLDMRFDRETPAGLGWLKKSGFNVYLRGESGRAFTPMVPVGEGTLAAVGNPYSRNGPFQIFTDIKASHYFKTGDRKLELSVGCTNVFNNHFMARLDPVTGKQPVWGAGSYTEAALINPSHFGGRDTPAYRNYLDNVKVANVDNPSNLGAGAEWRLQLDYDF